MDFEAISDAKDAEQSDRGMSEKIAVVALNPEFIEEQAHIFRNAWVPVCHESELPEPYDFRTASIGSENIIICRAPDGKINALLNVCPHRGMLIERRPQGSFLEGQASGNPKRITCMFHAWQFDMRGNCVYVAREKEGYQERFSKDDAGLRRLRCTVNFGGFVWVNMTDQPVAMLEEWAGPAMQSIENQISAVPLEVVHYHKEYVKTSYQAEALQYLNVAKAGAVFDYGHCVITGSDLGSEKQDVQRDFLTQTHSE
jgi:phenylpropionate dioxygenase-like ring-hydroxylating dioxygenase large terminal subunit